MVKIAELPGAMSDLKNSSVGTKIKDQNKVIQARLKASRLTETGLDIFVKYFLHF